MERYEIRIAGRVGPRRAGALACELVRAASTESVLVFAAVDQAALYGLLTRLRDAGLELVTADRTSVPQRAEAETTRTAGLSTSGGRGQDMSDQMIKLVIAGALAPGMARSWRCARGSAVDPGAPRHEHGRLARRPIVARPVASRGHGNVARQRLLDRVAGGVRHRRDVVLGHLVVPGSVWRPLAAPSALVSIAGIVLFIGTWPTFNTLAALGVNVAVFVAVLWLRWPSEAMLGR